MSYVLVAPKDSDVFKMPFLGILKLCAPIVSGFELTKYMYFTELIIDEVVLELQLKMFINSARYIILLLK